MSPRTSPGRYGSIMSASSSARSDEPESLTPREMEVVSWIARGKRNEEIGKILGCSTRTVKKHVQRALSKRRMETRTSLCAWWHTKGKKLAAAPGADPL
jgi:DNA-binding CsgD family transcriptional regulator